MTLPIDTLAYSNRLRYLFPQHKLVFAFTVLAIALFTHGWLQIIIFLWMSIWTVAYARIPFYTYLKMVLWALLFWVGSLPALVVNAVSVNNLTAISADVLKGISIGSYYLYLSHHGLESALVILARTLATTSCLYFIMLTVPFVEISEAMRGAGFPKILTELLLLIYRFIFMFLEAISELIIAQKSRNGYQNWRCCLRSLGMLIAELLSRTIQHYHQFSLGLAARGFNGELEFWASPCHHFSQRYAFEAIFGCGLLIFLSLL